LFIQQLNETQNTRDAHFQSSRTCNNSHALPQWLVENKSYMIAKTS